MTKPFGQEPLYTSLSYLLSVYKIQWIVDNVTNDETKLNNTYTPNLQLY